MPRKISEVLITGVAGFVGSNLAERLLKEGYRVRGVDDLSYGLRSQVPGGVNFRRGDIRDPNLFPFFKGVDAVFHLAAKNCLSDCQDDPVETADINVTGTANVLECCRKAGVRRVIYAESSALYEASRVFPTPETEIAPESFYARSKLAQRIFAEGYARFHGLRLTALRYFNVYGPRQDYRRTIPPVMSAFILALLRKQRPVIYGDGSQRRDFIYVDDVNDFHLRCLADPKTEGGTFNLGSGKNHSVLEIYRAVASLLGSPLKPVFKKALEGEARKTLADIRSARNLGWVPKTSLKEGLEHSVRYIREKVLTLP
jgi:nucleoside-diphosphate-sugar epimerase